MSQFQNSQYVTERTLDVDQMVQSLQSQEEPYIQPLSYSQPRSPTTNRPQRSNSTEQSTLSTPLPQVRRVKPQSMLRASSNVPPASDIDESYGDEGYQTGLSEHSSVRAPRSSRANSSRDAMAKNGTIMEENRIGAPSGTMSTMTDFFSSEVFHIVLHNPTTAHRFLKFCQSRACGETIEFLQRVTTYNRMLDEMATALGSIHTDFIASGSASSIGVPPSISKKVSNDLKEATYSTLPKLESLFTPAQQFVEQLLASDIYPRFVRHQITTAATLAMASHRERFSGLGDCFVLTDPHIADNPIVYSSDAFVNVTGYSRREIIPRNCRFLQGKQTDPKAVKRLKLSVESCEETVELLLNYRKNGDPFWNLLYVAPLVNERGEVVYFLGGQVDCSTTIHSCSDVLKVLSINDDELDVQESEKRGTPSIKREEGALRQKKTRSSWFKSWRKYRPAPILQTRGEAGMEVELIDRAGQMSFKTQVEAFYTAYSKYIVLHYNGAEQLLYIQHFSPGIIDMLHLTLPNGTLAPFTGKDIFVVFGENSIAGVGSAFNKRIKNTCHTSMREGKAVSFDLSLLTGFAEKKSKFLGSSSGNGGMTSGYKRVEESYVTHWTPLKAEDGTVKKCVLTIVPKM